MNTRKKPQCFVAMAFGHDDTDKFYDLLLEPVLRRNDVVPVIINRRESNDDLNQQIIDQLSEADFVVCDLTYARPSVYFEAGFAQRVSPVIYTVRADHLNSGQSDDLRVHFDLQMKPLVVWRDTGDSTFQTRFQRRLLATALKDWRARRSHDEAIAEARAEFAHRPLSVRLKDVQRAAVKQLVAAGFKVTTLERTGMNTKANEVLLKETCSKTDAARVLSFESLTKANLEALHRALQMDSMSLGIHAGRLRSKNVHVHYFLLCLRKVAVARIESALPQLRRDRASGSFYEDNDDEGRRTRVWWHFISPVESEHDLHDALEGLPSLAD